MSSISIESANATYGGESEEDTIKNMAEACNCQLIYKYANEYGDRRTHTDYFRVEKPGDEAELQSSRHVHKVVLVYDNGMIKLSKKKWWQFWR